MYHPGNWPGLGDCRNDKHRMSIDLIPPGAVIYTLREQMEDETNYWDHIIKVKIEEKDVGRFGPR